LIGKSRRDFINTRTKQTKNIKTPEGFHQRVSTGNPEIDRLDDMISSLTADNKQLKTSVRWLSAFMVMVIIILVYDQFIKIFS
jgi:hypothetical protein